MLREAPVLGFPETKPPIESFRGRLVPKVSPQRRHGVLQLEIGGILRAWARGRGDVATEWRFYLIPPRGNWSSLVPDVAYVSYERLPKDAPPEWREKPTIAPDLAVEILSPDDSQRILEEKIALYLEFGATAVLIVDPETRSILLVDAARTQARFSERATVTDERFPGLAIDVCALFAAAD
jgi:Uma2 family endonuclease